MVDHDVWQVFHLLSILAHIGMMVAGAVTFVSMGFQSLSTFDSIDLVNVDLHSMTKFVPTEHQSPMYSWAVFTIVSYSPDNSRFEQYRSSYAAFSWWEKGVLNISITGFVGHRYGCASLRLLAAGFQVTTRPRDGEWALFQTKSGFRCEFHDPDHHVNCRHSYWTRYWSQGVEERRFGVSLGFCDDRRVSGCKNHDRCV